MPPKSSITQLLRTDLGQSVGVTTATKLVWLTGLQTYAHRSTCCDCAASSHRHVALLGQRTRDSNITASKP